MMRYALVGCGLLLFAVGCQPTVGSEAGAESQNFGRFQGNVVASWDNDGRNMTLQEPFTFIDSQERVWQAPAGSVVNGASIPSAFWTLIGGPFEGKYRNASVVHDVGCEQMRESWEDVHRMFYEACRCGGVDEANAKILYYAVYHFGPRWQPITDTVVQVQQTPDGQLVEQEVTIQRMARLDPPPPTPEELEQVEAYVSEEDPAPEAIKRFNRDSLHQRPRHNQGHGSRRMPSRFNGADAGRTPGYSGRSPAGFSGGGNRAFPSRPGEFAAHPYAGNRPEPNLPPITPQEQQWASELVRQHIEQQAGEARPAQYTVERIRGAYRVSVQFLQANEQGEYAPIEGSVSTVRLSRQGQVLEFISGA